MSEPSPRLKRLKIRSWRRGTKEMDLILGPYFDACGAALDGATLDLYETMLTENDQDLYLWFSGQADCPAPYAALMDEIRTYLQGAKQI